MVRINDTTDDSMTFATEVYPDHGAFGPLHVGHDLLADFVVVQRRVARSGHICDIRQRMIRANAILRHIHLIVDFRKDGTDRLFMFGSNDEPVKKKGMGDQDLVEVLEIQHLHGVGEFLILFHKGFELSHGQSQGRVNLDSFERADEI